jgi:hypothetical protein
MEELVRLVDNVDPAPKANTHNDMVVRWMSDPEFKKAYDELEPQYAFFEQCIKARRWAKLTQKEVAERMGTKESAVARLESLAGSNRKPSPTVSTLQKYAAAVGCKLVLKLEPLKKKGKRLAPAVDGFPVGS